MGGIASARPAHPLVIAHRGASGARPENTLSAYAHAVEQRADMIEIDLHRSRDGAAVVRHDGQIEVVRHDGEREGLGGSHAIGDADLAEIRALDAGDGQRIPTLDEVLERFGDVIPFNLEIKIGPSGAYPELEAIALAAVEARDLLDQTLFSSFCDDVLGRLRARSPVARLAVLVSPKKPGRYLERARDVSAEAVNPSRFLATRELIDSAHADGLAVYPYTVDEPAEMRRLLSWGVDGLFTNYPDRLRALLENAEENPFRDQK